MPSSRNVLIVYAHPDPASFNGAVKNITVETLESEGYNVKVSDLYSLQFKPTTSKDDIIGNFTQQPFHYLTEVKAAVTEGRLSQDIMMEIEKLEWADLLILQFPIQWFGPPAILKGWFDRVLVNGRAFSGTELYSTGKFKGKRAIISCSTFGSRAMYDSTGIHGDINISLWPIQNGVFNFLGYDVLEPNVCFGVPMASEDERKKMLTDWKKRLTGLFEEKPLKFFSLNDFEMGGFGKLKDEALQRACESGYFPIGQREAKPAAKP